MLGDIETEVFVAILFDEADDSFSQGLEEMGEYCDEIEEVMDRIFN